MIDKSQEETRRLSPKFYYGICPTDGHREVIGFSGKFEYEIKHSCGEWTWENGNYCGHCGKRITLS